MPTADRPGPGRRRTRLVFRRHNVLEILCYLGFLLGVASLVAVYALSS
jgi:hypothetical protein